MSDMTTSDELKKERYYREKADKAFVRILNRLPESEKNNFLFFYFKRMEHVNNKQKGKKK